MTWLLTALLLSGAPDAGTALKVTALKNPIDVEAAHLRLDLKSHRSIYTGNVKVRRGTTRITCDRLIAYLVPQQGEQLEISRVECDGNVEVVDGNKWASGAHADFDNVKGLLVMTGSPKARQGQNQLFGEKITFDVVNDVVDVQGGAEKVRTTFESQGGALPLPGKGPKEKGAR